MLCCALFMYCRQEPLPGLRSASASRRQSLAAGAAAVATLFVGQAQARYGNWDGSSAAVSSVFIMPRIFFAPGITVLFVHAPVA